MQGHLTQLVEELIARHALSSEPVRQAFLAVPRHPFVPGTPVSEAYRADRAIPTHFDERGVPVSSASAPAIMAIMLELLDVAPGQRVLEIGAGTGYNAALLAHLVGDAGTVTSLDIDQEVSEKRLTTLQRSVPTEWRSTARTAGWVKAESPGSTASSPPPSAGIFRPIGSASSKKVACSSFPWRSGLGSRWRSHSRRWARSLRADPWPTADSCPSADPRRGPGEPDRGFSVG